MTAEIIKELTTIKDTSEITSEEVFSCKKNRGIAFTESCVRMFDTIRKSSAKQNMIKTQYLVAKTKYKKMQILWNITPAKAMPNIWENMWYLWQSHSLQECEEVYQNQTERQHKKADLYMK